MYFSMCALRQAAKDQPVDASHRKVPGNYEADQNIYTNNQACEDCPSRRKKKSPRVTVRY